MPTVFVAGRRQHRRVFHTDRDCPRLEAATHKIQERQLANLLDDRDDWTECTFCSDTADNPGWQSRHYQSLRAAAAEGPT